VADTIVAARRVCVKYLVVYQWRRSGMKEWVVSEALTDLEPVNWLAAMRHSGESKSARESYNLMSVHKNNLDEVSEAVMGELDCFDYHLKEVLGAFNAAAGT
jgi:hypothetical protein